MNNNIYPINRELKTETFTFSNKETFLFFEKIYINHAKEYNSIIASNISDSEDIVESYLRITDLQILLLIHTCMIIESIINYYGVIKFSDKFYTENIEKLTPISKKIIVLKSLCDNKLYSKTEPIIHEISTIFEKRNGFMHMKYKENKLNNVFDDGIIHLQKEFNLGEGEKYKTLITGLIVFLLGDEKDNGFFFLNRYDWNT